MAGVVAGSVRKLVSLFVVLVLALVVFNVAKSQGWLSPFGIRSSSTDSQVVQAIERTEEVSLLSLGIQGIKEEDRCSEVFGKCVPGSGEKAYLQYKFTAKLGLDGADVDVKKSGESSYRVTVPKFISIGFAEPTFEVAVEDGGVLSWVTEDIDKVEMINEILNDNARQKYIDANADLLRDQTKVFFDRLITSVDPDAETTYEFES